MPIRAQCPHCGHTYNVTEDSLGQTAKCRCGQTFVLSDTSSSESVMHAVIVDDPAAPAQPPPWIGDPRISVSAEPTNAPDAAACVRQIRTHLADFVARSGSAINDLELKVVMTECELGSRAERYLLSGLSGAASCGIAVN